MQVTGDAFAVLQDHKQFPFLLPAGPLHGQRGLPGEAGQQGEVVVGGGTVVGPVADHQDAVQRVGGGERGDHRRPGDHGPGPGRRGGEVVDLVVPARRGGRGEAGLGGGQHRADQFPGDRVGAVDHLDGELRLVLVVEQHQGQLGLGDLAGAAGHQGQRVGTAHLTEQHRGDLGGGGEPAFAPVRQRVEAGVLDRRAGRGGQRHHDLLVVLGELGRALLLGQVEVAPDVVADAHRHAEEAVHRRVVRREAVRVGVLGDVRHAYRLRLVDEQTQHAAAVRQLADLRVQFGADAVDDEVVQHAVGTDHAERAVAGAGQLARRLHDPLQRAAQIKVGPDADDSVQQGP